MENSKLESLKEGELMLTKARAVEGGKVEITFAQKINNPNARPASIVGLLNKSDERFNVTDKPRYAWVSGEPSDIKNLLNIDVSSLGLEDGQVKEMELDILNPSHNGQRFNIQITETTQGTDWDLANIETRAKRAGADGEYIMTAEGDHIFVKATVVLGTPEHVFIKNTTRSASPTSTGEAAIASVVG